MGNCFGNRALSITTRFCNLDRCVGQSSKAVSRNCSTRITLERQMTNRCNPVCTAHLVSSPKVATKVRHTRKHFSQMEIQFAGRYIDSEATATATFSLSLSGFLPGTCDDCSQTTRRKSSKTEPNKNTRDNGLGSRATSCAKPLERPLTPVLPQVGNKMYGLLSLQSMGMCTTIYRC